MQLNLKLIKHKLQTKGNEVHIRLRDTYWHRVQIILAIILLHESQNAVHVNFTEFKIRFLKEKEKAFLNWYGTDMDDHYGSPGVSQN